MADKQVNALTSSTPTTDDLTVSFDNADTSELKSVTWLAVRTLFKTYFDTIYAALGLATASGLTMSTNKLLWRWTASTGAIEEITLGTNLSFSGTTLNATGGSSWVTIGTTTITSGTSGRILYDNAGVVGELATTGSWNVVLSTSPTLVTPALGTPSSWVATNLTGTATGLTSGITNALKSATTTVDVSAATAPSSGQVLTATSSTTATWQAPPVFCWVLAIQTSTWTITDNSLDLINFDNELYDTDSFHNTSTNNWRLTVPSGKAGKYDVRAQIETSKTDATIFYTLAIYKNWVITHIKNQKLWQQTSNPTYQDSCAQISWFIDLAVGDYIELYVSQNNSWAWNSTTVAAGTWFWMTLMK